MSNYHENRAAERLVQKSEAKRLFLEMGVDFRAYNDDYQLNIQSNKGIIAYYPTTGSYVLNGKTDRSYDLQSFFELLRDKFGYTPIWDDKTQNLKQYIIGKIN